MTLLTSFTGDYKSKPQPNYSMPMFTVIVWMEWKKLSNTLSLSDVSAIGASDVKNMTSSRKLNARAQFQH